MCTDTSRSPDLLRSRTFQDPAGDHRRESVRPPPCGCRKLLLAVLEDCFLLRNEARRLGPGCSLLAWKRRQVENDARWLASDDETPFSFVWLCRHLALEPACLRRAYDTGQSLNSNALSAWRHPASTRTRALG